jgi:uncharacterized membrane protein YcaP (DUF421 family)
VVYFLWRFTWFIINLQGIMEWCHFLFGEGKDLNTLQMCSRGVVIFFICLVFIRISGRRSFGLRTPLDNIIVILLGALLSRAVVGASPFIPIVASGLVFVVLHRLLAWVILRNKKIATLVEGNKICLYKENKVLPDKMKRALVSEEDMMQGVRESALTEDLNKIEAIYMERNGNISPIKKE